ncbi:tyrosine-type recombinase/integrase [Stappia sp. 28M-7]|uniref:tyrosine-type recombinase/integrase n=1 Tax=Stappia sp. 28M-7 TaxID=2762596 RepID=UPI0035301308
MAGRVRHLHQDSRGRFYARVSVPAELRAALGKRELLKALGGDRQVALRALPEVIAGFNRQIESARTRLGSVETAGLAEKPVTPLTVEEISALHYADRLRADEELRDLTPGYARIGIDDGYVADVKQIVAGAASNALIHRIFGREIETHLRNGSYSCSHGGADWRRLARHLAYAEIEVLKRMFERDEGQLVTEHPQWALDHAPKPASEAVIDDSEEGDDHETSIRALFEACRKAKAGGQGGERTTKAYTGPVESLIAFLGADNVTLLTNRRISDWLSHLQFERGLAAKTVNSRYLTMVKSTLKWASNHGYIEPIAITASVSVPKKRLNREKGYTDEEARRALEFAYSYVRPADTRESDQLSAAKRWAPWLAHFTGARIGEITQLRKQDISERDGVAVMRITPDAGTTKTGLYRDVPLHRQLIEQGFLEFVKDATDDPLFYPKRDGEQEAVKSAETISNRVAKWLKDADMVPTGVAPLHGFRHAFKTNARIHGLSDRVSDAIQGHASRTAGDDYGDVTIDVKKREIEKQPDVRLDDAIDDGGRH